MNKVKVKALAFASFLMIVNPAFAGEGGGGAGISMALLQWACLLVLLSIGYKIAWKPILKDLSERESKIEKSIEDSEKARTELEDVQKTCEKLKRDAENEAKSIIVSARETAQKVAKSVEEKAKAEAQSSRDNALKDIENAKQEAVQSLKSQTSELAISLASKLLGENLDNEKNRALTEKLINKI